MPNAKSMPDDTDDSGESPAHEAEKSAARIERPVAATQRSAAAMQRAAVATQQTVDRNERVGVRQYDESVEYTYRLVKAFAAR
jgi:hypothetical protein